MTDDGGLKITDSAISQLNALITSKANPELRFRVYVQGGGCSGFQYGFQFEEESALDDIEFDRNGVKLVVDPLSLQYLSGAEVDFIDDLMGTRFIVNNPNASTTCGCGASFGI
ncbi:MAG TPA: iron-sulfur cluster insertion protein ErpA [Gammaproteobacteria bacterium]|nr:iron-sulfur cluster insertion protein ErpA [Gammaproteobacteria bacterium]